jgi:hypothetical protein
MEVRTSIPDPRLLHATSALNVVAGEIGGAGSAAGAVGDTLLMGVTILKNAGPATLTIAGFRGEDGTARNILLTGSSTVDTVYNFGFGLRNTGAAMTVTASVADVVLVSLQPA